ncbi:MAG: class I SAM-dependent methyltransferase [Rhizorhabdus sp.]
MIEFKDHFSSHATAYAAYRPGYPPKLAAWLASITPTAGCALDVGCGSGQLALLLSSHFDHVVATDPSAAQIASAVRHPHIDYRLASAEASGLPGGSVDLLTAAQSAHWFDLPKFFAEARRLLKPDGVIALITYAGMEHRGPIERLVERFRLETLQEYWPPERAMVENHYRDIALPFAAIAAPAFAVEVSWPLNALIGYIGTWSAMREMEKRIGGDPIADIAAELAEAWGDPEIHRTFRWPLTILAGRP